MKKIIKYLVGIIVIALVYLLISNFNLVSPDEYEVTFEWKI